MPSKFRYTDEMINFIREKKEKMCYTELTKEFNKTFGQNKSVKAIVNGFFRSSLFKKTIGLDDEVKEFIKKNIFGLSFKEITKKVNEEFNIDKTVKCINAFCNRNKIYSKGKNKRGFIFTDEMVIFIKNNIGKSTYKDILKMFNEHFSVDISEGNFKNKCRRLNISNRRNILSEHYCTKGTCIIKIENGKWAYKHRILWEQKNGPISDEYVVMFADGDKTNFSENNLVKVSKKENFYLNKRKLRFSDPEYTKAGLNIVKMLIKAEERQKELDNEKSKKKNQPEEAD